MEEDDDFERRMLAVSSMPRIPKLKKDQSLEKLSGDRRSVLDRADQDVTSRNRRLGDNARKNGLEISSRDDKNNRESMDYESSSDRNQDSRNVKDKFEGNSRRESGNSRTRNKSRDDTIVSPPHATTDRGRDVRASKRATDSREIYKPRDSKDIFRQKEKDSEDKWKKVESDKRTRDKSRESGDTSNKEDYSDENRRQRKSGDFETNEERETSDRGVRSNTDTSVHLPASRIVSDIKLINSDTKVKDRSTGRVKRSKWDVFQPTESNESLAVSSSSNISCDKPIHPVISSISSTAVADIRMLSVSPASSMLTIDSTEEFNKKQFDAEWQGLLTDGSNSPFSIFPPPRFEPVPSSLAAKQHAPNVVPSSLIAEQNKLESSSKMSFSLDSIPSSTNVSVEQSLKSKAHDNADTEVIDMDVSSVSSYEESPSPKMAGEEEVGYNGENGDEKRSRRKVTFDCPEENDAKERKIIAGRFKSEKVVLKKADAQEVVVAEIKEYLRPLYLKRKLTKEEYKEVMRKAVPKIIHGKRNDLSQARIHAYTSGYLKKILAYRKSSQKDEPLLSPDIPPPPPPKEQDVPPPPPPVPAVLGVPPPPPPSSNVPVIRPSPLLPFSSLIGYAPQQSGFIVPPKLPNFLPHPMPSATFMPQFPPTGVSGVTVGVSGVAGDSATGNSVNIYNEQSERTTSTDAKIKSSKSKRDSRHFDSSQESSSKVSKSSNTRTSEENEETASSNVRSSPRKKSSRHRSSPEIERKREKERDRVSLEIERKREKEKTHGSRRSIDDKSSVQKEKGLEDVQKSESRAESVEDKTMTDKLNMDKNDTDVNKKTSSKRNKSSKTDSEYSRSEMLESSPQSDPIVLSPEFKQESPKRHNRRSSPGSKRDFSPKSKRERSPKSNRHSSPETKPESPRSKRNTSPKIRRDSSSGSKRESPSKRDTSPKTRHESSPRSKRKSKYDSSPSPKRDTSPKDDSKSRHDSLSRSKHDGSPRSKRDGSPRSKRDASPRSKRDGSPRSKRDASPRSKRDGSPRSKRDVSPRSKRDGSPRSKRDGSPRSKRDGSPGSKRDASPRSKRDASPRSKRDGSPRFRHDSSSRSKRDGSSRSKGDGSPRSKCDGSPRSKRDGSPRSKRDGSPMSKRDGSPRSNRDGSPKSKRDGSPRSKRDGSPMSKRDGSPRSKHDGSPRSKRDGSPRSRRDGSPMSKRDGSSRSKRDGSSRSKRDGSPRSKRDGSPRSKRHSSPRLSQDMSADSVHDLPSSITSDTYLTSKQDTSRNLDSMHEEDSKQRAISTEDDNKSCAIFAEESEIKDELDSSRSLKRRKSESKCETIDKDSPSTSNLHPEVSSDDHKSPRSGNESFLPVDTKESRGISSIKSLFTPAMDAKSEESKIGTATKLSFSIKRNLSSKPTDEPGFKSLFEPKAKRVPSFSSKRKSSPNLEPTPVSEPETLSKNESKSKPDSSSSKSKDETKSVHDTDQKSENNDKLSSELYDPLACHDSSPESLHRRSPKRKSSPKTKRDSSPRSKRKDSPNDKRASSPKTKRYNSPKSKSDSSRDRGSELYDPLACLDSSPNSLRECSPKSKRDSSPRSKHVSSSKSKCESSPEHSSKYRHQSKTKEAASERNRTTSPRSSPDSSRKSKREATAESKSESASKSRDDSSRDSFKQSRPAKDSDSTKDRPAMSSLDILAAELRSRRATAGETLERTGDRSLEGKRGHERSDDRKEQGSSSRNSSKSARDRRTRRSRSRDKRRSRSRDRRSPDRKHQSRRRDGSKRTPSPIDLDAIIIDDSPTIQFEKTTKPPLSPSTLKTKPLMDEIALIPLPLISDIPLPTLSVSEPVITSATQVIESQENIIKDVCNQSDVNQKDAKNEIANDETKILESNVELLNEQKEINVEMKIFSDIGLQKTDGTRRRKSRFSDGFSNVEQEQSDSDKSKTVISSESIALEPASSSAAEKEDVSSTFGESKGSLDKMSFGVSFSFQRRGLTTKAPQQQNNDVSKAFADNDDKKVMKSLSESLLSESTAMRDVDTNKSTSEHKEQKQACKSVSEHVVSVTSPEPTDTVSLYGDIPLPAANTDIVSSSITEACEVETVRTESEQISSDVISQPESLTTCNPSKSEMTDSQSDALHSNKSQENELDNNNVNNDVNNANNNDNVNNVNNVDNEDDNEMRDELLKEIFTDNSMVDPKRTL